MSTKKSNEPKWYHDPFSWIMIFLCCVVGSMVVFIAFDTYMDRKLGDETIIAIHEDLGKVTRIDSCYSSKHSYSCDVYTDKNKFFDALDIGELSNRPLQIGDQMMIQERISANRYEKDICVSYSCAWRLEFQPWYSDAYKQKLKELKDKNTQK